ncbi:hypothetical protein N657DRAFT_690040 [Parathielavia appendiculata]|uniref:2EXR domain-containing protein n=1 Tax=Parathielavia appendiculata TaxID=2587402 RepID=A0AAN6U158_9PEZI|nr:hypothetical protein N657DRAFT_690040 [Parathielavia appendiculata]
MSSRRTSDTLCTRFPLFPFLPLELQDLIWDQAATLSPQIHFFLGHRQPISTWEAREPPLNLIPHRESGAHTQVSLSLTCHASRGAVERHTKTIILQRPTVMCTAGKPSASPSVALVLNLETDLVCFGGPDADGSGVWDAINWGEGNHLVFGGAKRFAVRYKPGWEHAGPGSLPHDVRCPGGWVGARKGEKAGFCSRCVARLMERFVWLNEFYLILDEADFGDTEELGKGKQCRVWLRPGSGPRVFYSFSRTYFMLDVAGIPGTDATVTEACGVLNRLRANLRDPGHNQMPWVKRIKMGLMIWRQDM